MRIQTVKLVALLLAATASLAQAQNPNQGSYMETDLTIAGWNPNVNATTAVLKVDKSGASSVYKGLALGQVSGTGSVIYAADLHNGNVDVFDTAFNPVDLGRSAFEFR